MRPLSVTMTISVKGVFRRKIAVGFSIFKSDKWVEEPFCWNLDTETSVTDYSVPVADLELIPETSEDKVFIRAMIRSRAYVLGDVTIGQARAFSFSVLSIKDIEVRGRVCALTGIPEEDAGVIAEINLDNDFVPRRRSRRKKR